MGTKTKKPNDLLRVQDVFLPRPAVLGFRASRKGNAVDLFRDSLLGPADGTCPRALLAAGGIVRADDPLRNPVSPS